MTRPGPSRPLALLLILVAASLLLDGAGVGPGAAPGAAAPAAAAPPVPTGGPVAPVIASPAEPLHGVRTLVLEELWRRGGEDDEEIFFGLIAQVAADEEGNVYLLDGQLSQVPVFGPDGELLRILSREGDGPGETRRPGDLFLTDDGRVGLAVTFPGRVVYVDRQGQPAGVLELGDGDATRGGFSVLRTARAHRDRTILGVTRVRTDQAAGRQTRTAQVVIRGAAGEPEHVLCADTYVLDFNERVFREAEQLDLAQRRLAVGPDGRVYVAPEREAYRIEVFAPDGRCLHAITREYPVHRRTAAELEEWRRLYVASMRNAPFEVGIELCETAAPIDWVFGGLHARQDGTLWVHTSRSASDQPEGVMLTYDVFDPDGRFTEQVQVACAGDGQEDALFFIGPDRAILVRGMMDAIRARFGGVEGHEDHAAVPMEIVCYAVR